MSRVETLIKLMLSKQGNRVSFGIGITGTVRLSIRIIFDAMAVGSVKYYFRLTAKAPFVKIPEHGSSAPGSAYFELVYYSPGYCSAKRSPQELHKRISLVSSKGSFNHL
jgi:hypothetical protein